MVLTLSIMLLHLGLKTIHARQLLIRSPVDILERSVEDARHDILETFNAILLVVPTSTAGPPLVAIRHHCMFRVFARIPCHR